MNIFKLPPTHIASQLMTAIADAEAANELIESIALNDDEFAELLACETVKNTTSKWYGSNEGGLVLTNIQTQMLEVNGVQKPVPVLAYFKGIKIVRS